MAQVGARIGPEAELGLVAWKEQNMLMADRAVVDFGFKQSWDDQLQGGVSWQAQAPGRWLLVQEDALQGCIDRQRAELTGISNRRRWWLVPPEAVTGPCVATEEERARADDAQGREVD